MISKANVVCAICKRDCMSTEKMPSAEKMVCLLKNAGGFFGLHQQSAAPATLGDGSKMPGVSSVDGTM